MALQHHYDAISFDRDPVENNAGDSPCTIAILANLSVGWRVRGVRESVGTATGGYSRHKQLLTVPFMLQDAPDHPQRPTVPGKRGSRTQL
jgi:hypothetical protein